MKHTVTRLRQPTGVCVVRAEPQGHQLLITVTTNPDVESRIPTTLSRYALDSERALRLVADFLQQVEDLNRSGMD